MILKKIIKNNSEHTIDPPVPPFLFMGVPPFLFILVPPILFIGVPPSLFI
jgi:hypothetical protein